MIFAYVLFALLAAVTVYAYGMRTDQATHMRDREDAHRAKHGRRTAWIKYARERHYQLWRARAGATYVLRGTHDEVPVVLDVYLSETPTQAMVRARAVDPRPFEVRAWRPEIAITGEASSPPEGPRSPLGVAEFDEAYQVKTETRDALTVLDERVRRALLEMPGVTCFEYARGEVRLEWTGAEPGQVDRAIEVVVAACRPGAAAAAAAGSARSRAGAR
jgi:hypothetical protein